MTNVKWIAARGPDEDSYRIHAEEPDARDAFMCGLPPQGTGTRPPAVGDVRCEVCEFCASEFGHQLVKEGRKLQARRSTEDWK